MANHLNAIFDGLQELDYVASSLWGLASAFERTGNKLVSDELHEMADGIRTQADAIRRAYAAEVGNRADAAVENSRAMLQAVVAGVLLAKEGSEP
jgi:hypothetical protein